MICDARRVLLVVASVACAAPTRSRSWVDQAAAARTGHHLGASRERSALPPDCSPNDGLDPEEAAAVALWRSPALRAELARLDTALADLDEASRLPNPRLSFLAPLDPRQLAVILSWPVDALWQRPFREETALRELEVVAENLVQSVLDLERDARRAHAEAVRARARSTILGQLAERWRETASLTQARAQAGDVSLAEASAARAEAGIAADEVARAQQDLAVMDARLRAVLAEPWPVLPPLVEPPRGGRVPTRDRLVRRALEARPDLKATALAVHAAAAHARWERSRAFALVAVLDGQAPRGELAPNFSGGAQLDVPLFSFNQGGVGRAEAAVNRASNTHLALRLSITAEVIAASAARDQASASLVAYDEALRALAVTSLAARSAYERGEESYLFVVDALRRESLARLRRADLRADLARAEADLARAVGGRLPEESPP